MALALAPGTMGHSLNEFDQEGVHGDGLAHLQGSLPELIATYLKP